MCDDYMNAGGRAMLEQRSGVPRNEAHQSRTMGFLRQPILYLKVSSATRNNKVQLTKTEQSKE